jgi:hypothetical protein
MNIPANLRYGNCTSIYDGSNAGVWPDQTNVSLPYRDFDGMLQWRPKVQGAFGHVLVIVGGFEKAGEEHFILQNTWKGRECLVIARKALTPLILGGFGAVYYYFGADYMGEIAARRLAKHRGLSADRRRRRRLRGFIRVLGLTEFVIRSSPTGLGPDYGRKRWPGRLGSFFCQIRTA